MAVKRCLRFDGQTGKKGVSSCTVFVVVASLLDQGSAFEFLLSAINYCCKAFLLWRYKISGLPTTFLGGSSLFQLVLGGSNSFLVLVCKLHRCSTGSSMHLWEAFLSERVWVYIPDSSSSAPEAGKGLPFTVLLYITCFIVIWPSQEGLNRNKTARHKISSPMQFARQWSSSNIILYPDDI